MTRNYGWKYESDESDAIRKSFVMYMKINQLRLCVTFWLCLFFVLFHSFSLSHSLFACTCMCLCDVHSAQCLTRPRLIFSHTLHIQSYSTHMQSMYTWLTNIREMKYHFSTFNSPFFRHARFERLQLFFSPSMDAAFDAFVSPSALIPSHIMHKILKAWNSSSIYSTHRHTQAHKQSS